MQPGARPKARLSIALEEELFAKLEQVVKDKDTSYTGAVAYLLELGYDAWVCRVIDEDILGEDVLKGIIPIEDRPDFVRNHTGTTPPPVEVKKSVPDWAKEPDSYDPTL